MMLSLGNDMAVLEMETLVSDDVLGALGSLARKCTIINIPTESGNACGVHGPSVCICRREQSRCGNSLAWHGDNMRRRTRAFYAQRSKNNLHCCDIRISSLAGNPSIGQILRLVSLLLSLLLAHLTPRATVQSFLNSQYLRHPKRVYPAIFPPVSFLVYLVLCCAMAPLIQ
jgi:hypothetical protein